MLQPRRPLLRARPNDTKMILFMIRSFHSATAGRSTATALPCSPDQTPAEQQYSFFCNGLRGKLPKQPPFAYSSPMKKILPPLRYVDIVPVEEEGRAALLSAGSPRLCPGSAPAQTPPPSLWRPSSTGKPHSKRCRKPFQKQFDGHPITEDQVLEVVQVLDRHGYLYTRTFEALRQQIEGGFRRP